MPGQGGDDPYSPPYQMWPNPRYASLEQIGDTSPISLTENAVQYTAQKH